MSGSLPAGVVLAAGLGRRLRPLTDVLPKALCPVANVPLVDGALEAVSGLVEDVAVNVHHGRTAMVAHLAGRAHLSLEGPAPLGTAGALGALRGWIAGRDVLVVNADAWHRIDLGLLVRDWDGETVRLLVVEDPERADFGTGRYAGACLMPWAEVAALGPEPSGLYHRCWRPRWEHGVLDLVVADGPFFDCGTPPEYLAANLTASGGASVVGPGAVVEGSLERSVVWAGGEVRHHERLVESIRVGRDLTVAAPLSVLPPRVRAALLASGDGLA
ncbi:MAG TPA: sugar phosphate nucleotidyltransferase [Acidimicrobiales bacterium]|nr:sugar phosphate nucleotidyltransferase [Acidimicrobiales bacterium]